MNDWYIDRSKNFINDKLDNALQCFKENCEQPIESTDLGQKLKDYGVLGNAEGNPNAALTRFRDHGFLRTNNTIGDTAIDYLDGKLTKSELIIDLLIKRPAKKSDSPNIKPLVLLCQLFDNMMEMDIDPDDIFITYAECKEYLYGIDKYENNSFELVEKIINDRKYEISNCMPIPRIEISPNEEINISIWFNALQSTPVFMPKNEERKILRPNLKQKEFFRFISVNAEEFSATPTNGNTEQYKYYCDRNTGLLEILPKVIIPNINFESVEETKIIFDYLFGYQKLSSFAYDKFVKYECFGLFFPFITLPGLVIRQIESSNKIIADVLYEFIKSNNNYFTSLDTNNFQYKGMRFQANDEFSFNPKENEQIFKDWMKTQIDKQNKPCNENMINRNCMALRNVVKKLQLINQLEIDSIFEIYNLDDFYECLELIKSQPTYNEVNLSYGNGYVSSGLLWYELFLKTHYSKEKIFEKYDKNNFLNDIFLDENEYLKLKLLLEYKKNIILQGAPGVGKTFVAKKLAYSIIGEKNDCFIELIQFHQSYSYEDFIMGYKPTDDGFELKEGMFYSFCKKAKNDKEHKYFLIIDEINRGNLSKIFGELLMLIEGDKRNEKITLAYGNEEFFVPNNVYIIGTMNTADRSLALMDYALRRRFIFYDIKPAFDNEKFKKYLLTFIKQETVEKIVNKLNNLNEYICDEDKSDLGPGFCIGHSYFCVKLLDGQNESDWYMNIMKYEIMPLLEEYWWDDKSKVQEWQKKLIED